MLRKFCKIGSQLFIMSVLAVTGLAGCSQVTNEVEVNEVVNHQENRLERVELTKRIILLNPELEDELDNKSTEELQELYEKLKINRERKIRNRIKEVDEEQQIDEEDIRHHHDPHPPQPPIYEKPRPVPDPPIEEE